MIFSVFPKFRRNSAAIKSTPGALFAFRLLNAFSNSSVKIESSLSSFCTSFTFSMRSATASSLYTPLYVLYQLLTLSLLCINAFPFTSLTIFALICLFLKFSLIFLWAASTFSILNRTKKKNYKTIINYGIFIILPYFLPTVIFLNCSLRDLHFWSNSMHFFLLTLTHTIIEIQQILATKSYFSIV